MFGLANELNAKRATQGLPPLVSLGIGVPHMYVAQQKYLFGIL
jgi:hypothetical protein